MRPTQERYLEDKPDSNKMGNNKEGAINNKRSVLVTTLNNFVVTNNCVREFTTNSLDMGTRRTVKTNNTMLPSTPISTSTSWTTPSPHPTTQTGSPTDNPGNKIAVNLNIVDNTESTPYDADVVANRVDPGNKIAVNLNIVDNTESTPYDADVVANRVNPDNKIAANLNIMDNTEFTINSTDVDTSRAVQAIINNAAINSTDWLSVRLPMPSRDLPVPSALAAASTMIALIARLRATTSATMQTGTTSTP